MKSDNVLLRDADIRPALRSVLSGKHADENDTVFVEELGVCRGRVRVDLAVVNGSFHGYEIKSDRDSFRRLSAQIDYYGKVLDRATLVVTQRHLPGALDMLPPWWGVIRVWHDRHAPRFVTIRRGGKNQKRDARSLVEFLWLDEALSLLESRQVARGVRGKPRKLVWDRLCEHFSLDEIAEAVRARLKARAA